MTANVSIPYSTIKINIAGSADDASCKFQFLIVRLKFDRV